MIFAVAVDARHGNGILAFRVGGDRWRRFRRELIDVGCKFVRRVECVFVRHFLAGMGGHAAERSNHAGGRAAFDFVVRLILPNGGDQLIPFQLVRMRLGLFRLPNQLVVIDLLATVNAALGGRMARGADDG